MSDDITIGNLKWIMYAVMVKKDFINEKGSKSYNADLIVLVDLLHLQQDRFAAPLLHGLPIKQWL